MVVPLVMDTAKASMANAKAINIIVIMSIGCHFCRAGLFRLPSEEYLKSPVNIRQFERVSIK